MNRDLAALRAVKDFPSLVNYLRDELDWRGEGDSEIAATSIEDLTYDFLPEELGLDPHEAPRLREIHQLIPFVSGQPWGIFFVNFGENRMHVGTLRGVLRGLVKRKRASANKSDLATWEQENLLFICTSDNFNRFDFAYFRGAQTSRAVLSTFGWQQGDSHVRTLLEYNLSALALPSDVTDVEGWLKKWRTAFDVEAVTNKFFDDYKQVFELVEAEVRGTVRIEEDARLYTQRLFNRLMFLYFIQKKGWLEFEGEKNYLRALLNKAESEGGNFLRERLYYAFFWGMSNVGEARETHTLETLIEKRGHVPYLNGGLFDIEDEYDSDRDKVKISNGAFVRIFDLFERYNFTIEESTPLNVQVAVDPEMLGKVFEELVTGRESRQDAGRYYTPRNIVSFMCREALKKHLGGYEALIDERKADAVNVPEANDLLSKIDKLRVVDPACGSGAYLLGMLHELHALINLLQTRGDQATARDDYKSKLNIIERNLYGVDRDNLAVQIARFRLWLSLVIEYDDQIGIDELPTLPNLDFKIECGDSLTAPNPEKVKLGSFRTELINQYREAKSKFLSAHGNEKGQLRNEIKQLGEKIRNEAAFWLYGNVTFEGFDWAIEFAEVFDKGGFDVVLANPPYGATVADNVRDLYFDRRTEGAQSKDTYGLFIARGLQLLRDGGQLCFIVSDTWRTIKTHKPLRRRLVEKTTVWHVLDLPVWIFNATVNTGILTITKQPAKDDHQLIAGDLRGIGRGDWDTLTKNLLAVAAHGVDVQTLTYARYTYPQTLIPTYDNCPFFIASPQLYKLMSDPRFAKLDTLADVRVGLQTGDNGHYLRKRSGVRGSYEILDESKLLSDEEIAALTDDEKFNGITPNRHGGKHFLPYDKGGESEAGEGWMPNYYVPTGYFIDWSRAAVRRLQAATIADVKRRKGDAHKIKPSDESAIASRFQNRGYYFREGVTFSRTGIYAPTYRLNSASVFDTEGSAIFTNRYSPRALLGLLCSTLSRYIIKVFVDHSVHAQIEDIKEFITVELSEEQENQLTSLVSAIIEKQRINQRYSYHLHEQREIDALVYQLYGLTQDDIREIELWYCRRYPRLAEAQGMMQSVAENYAPYLERTANIIAKPPAYWRSHPLLTLIAEELEGQHFELKESLEVDLKTGAKNSARTEKTLKTIAAFLNTDGGKLIIGVSNAGEIKGLAPDLQFCHRNDEDGFELKLRDLIQSHLTPDPLNKVKIRFEHLPEGSVCIVEVQRSNDITLVDKKHLYIRLGNRTEKRDGQAALSWAQERGALNK